MNAAAKTPISAPTSASDWHESVRRRAEEIYIRNGGVPGRDLENWAQAEQEILRESSEHTSRRAIIVKVNGAAYIGEYDPASSDYLPGEFGTGASVPVRFRGDRMYVKRPNGRILETTVVKQIR